MTFSPVGLVTENWKALSQWAIISVNGPRRPPSLGWDHRADGTGNMGDIVEMTLGAIIPPLVLCTLRCMVTYVVQYFRIRKSSKRNQQNHCQGVCPLSFISLQKESYFSDHLKINQYLWLGFLKTGRILNDFAIWLGIQGCLP